MAAAHEVAQTVSVWGTLLPVIVGGLIGVLGTIVGPPLLQLLNEKSTRKQRRLAQFEELVAAIYAFDDWQDQARLVRVFDEKIVLPPNPMAKIRTLTAVHFQEFEDCAGKFEVAAGRYASWMYEAAQRRLRAEVDKISDGMADAYRPYLDSRNAFLDQLKDYARHQLR